MGFEAELNFLCDVLEKSHIPVDVLCESDLVARLDSSQIEGLADPYFKFGGGIERDVRAMNMRTLYRLSDSFHRCFYCLRLPGKDIARFFLAGPFLTGAITQKGLLDIGEEINIIPQKQKYLNEYYASMATVTPNSPISVMIESFCELIWQTPSFAVEQLSSDAKASEHLLHSTAEVNSPSEVMINVKALERRYAFENELLRAVSLGQLHLEDRFLVAFSVGMLEKRAKDPLRNAKNYAIIMNTLFRKAAEDGGVHPVHLDQISSELANKIESLSSMDSCGELMRDIFRSYCRLVNKYSVNKYSPVVKKAMLTIDADLSADLSTGKLAKSQGISLGYLSTVFKREVGQTLSDYIRGRRLEYAKYLLRTTDMQIQTVALQCGILDVQYFTKMFKQKLGTTPSEYRAAKKQINL